MTIHFYLRYSTHYGETIFVTGNIENLGNNEAVKALPMAYLNEQVWYATLEVDVNKIKIPLQYKYFLTKEDGENILEFGNDRVINLLEHKTNRLELIDVWNYTGEFENAFYTQPFQQVLLPNLNEPVLKNNLIKSKKYTHEFKVKSPLLKANETICIAGSVDPLQNWDTISPLLMQKQNNWYSIKINLAKQNFPIAYKYGIYNIKLKKFVQFEGGNNRFIIADTPENTITILHDGFTYLTNNNWKGAGVAIPVFSLRSNNSIGCGEFNDINLLVDWAKKTNIKLIQLLPINDTIATNSAKDSYPYSAISAFAMHPMYLNIETIDKIANNKLLEQKIELNKQPIVNYVEVVKLKVNSISEIYLKQKNTFLADANYQTFFNENQYWLIPYAAFCYLRDVNNSADFEKWKSNSKYNKTEILELVAPTQKHFDSIAIHYFTQYHLHLQLKAATEYAHQNQVVIKGDIPIGIGKHSVDAWVNPSLYNMNDLAGAPPDAFATKGQNWGFPTYNWQVMQQDNFAWWRQRFLQMSTYFDAFRIDHILGFFRIWSIPTHTVEGILGRFVPALPIHINEFFENGIPFIHHRYTKPFITEKILIDSFGSDVEKVKKIFFDDDELKEEYNTQQKVASYFEKNNFFNENIKQSLFDIISNVLFIEDENGLGQQFHCRIGMEQTSSFQNLEPHIQEKLKNLYINYFYKRQDELWRKEALTKLPSLKSSTSMLICGEDLGMVPHCVPEIMQQLGILSLEIQRMPKQSTKEFFHPADAPYLSVVSPSTHDMSTIREWWQEDGAITKRFYNSIMGHNGEAPYYAETWICKEIILQHLYSPAMWSIFQLQDILSISGKLRREKPEDDRINEPANPNHVWNYRMHLNVEDLIKEDAFNLELKNYIVESGRA